MKTAYTINAIGLILDIIGVIGIYLLRIKPLKQVPYSKIVNGFFDPLKYANELIDNLNNNIETTNKRNHRIGKISIIFFLFIIGGFILQFVSVYQFLNQP
jgi:hypothetical protein